MFRRRGRDDPEQVPEWRPRIDAARQLIAGQSSSDLLSARLDDAVESLTSAEADRARIEQQLSELDPDRATAELKSALRARPAGTDEAHDRLVATMRARYEAIHAVIDRRDALASAIERAVADVELLAARSVTASVDPTQRAELDRSLDQLRIDLDVLADARREVAGW